MGHTFPPLAVLAEAISTEEMAAPVAAADIDIMHPEVRAAPEATAAAVVAEKPVVAKVAQTAALVVTVVLTAAAVAVARGIA